MHGCQCHHHYMVIGEGAEGGTGPLLSGKTSPWTLRPSLISWLLPMLLLHGEGGEGIRGTTLANDDMDEDWFFFFPSMFGLRGRACVLKHKTNIGIIRHTQ